MENKQEVDDVIMIAVVVKEEIAQKRGSGMSVLRLREPQQRYKMISGK